MGLRVAVVGATGAVGREMLTTLAERNFPADEVIALASSKSTGAQVSFGEDQVLTVADLDSYDFTGTDIALFSAGGAIAEKYAPKAAAAEKKRKRKFREFDQAVAVGVSDAELQDARTKLAELQANAERDPAAPPAIVLPDSLSLMATCHASHPQHPLSSCSC